jgi:hypothetical protein
MPAVQIEYVMLFGARARMSGKAKVVVPFPPYVVPMSENSAVFWLIGRTCSSSPCHRGDLHPRHRGTRRLQLGPDEVGINEGAEVCRLLLQLAALEPSDLE